MATWFRVETEGASDVTLARFGTLSSIPQRMKLRLARMQARRGLDQWIQEQRILAHTAKEVPILSSYVGLDVVA